MAHILFVVPSNDNDIIIFWVRPKNERELERERVNENESED